MTKLTTVIFTLAAGRAQLDSFQGIIFVGGFSYADVLDSAKGWAGTIRFNERVLKQFQEFYNRWALSLGICIVSRVGRGCSRVSQCLPACLQLQQFYTTWVLQRC
jgi:phosphoribosylformylglycinamidine (FGAM) synthase-like amidotransferase family enzyme